jgi:NADPH2:quinone reductase
MSTASKGFRYARCGPISKVLKLDTFDTKLAKKSDIVVKMSLAPIHRTDAAVINGTALGRRSKVVSTTHPALPMAAFPRTGGFEGVGVVTDAGQNSRVKEGDKVWISPSAGVGTWSTHVAVDAEHVHVVPKKSASPALTANSSALLAAHQLLNGYRTLEKGDVVLQNGGSSLTATAVAHFAAQQGLTLVTAVAKGERYAAAEKRQKALGATVVEYCSAAARTHPLAKGAHAEGAKLFLNGVGGKPFNCFCKLLGDGSTAVTYGAQSGFGLMWTGTQHVHKDFTHTGLNLARFLRDLSYEERQALLELVHSNAGKLAYPTAEVKLDALPKAWNDTYLVGGQKHVIAF